MSKATRTCRRCKRTRPLTPQFFQRQASCIDGFMPNCKDCVNSRKRELLDMVIVDYRKVPAMRALRYMGFDYEQIADDLGVTRRQVEVSLREAWV